MNDVNLDQPLPVAEALKRRGGVHAATAPRARTYVRLLWIIPGLLLLAVGLYAYYDVEDDGIVHTLQLTTKPGMVGQAAEALRLVQFGTPDLYLKIKTTAGVQRTVTYKDTPLGNGLRWSLATPVRMREIQEVEVWDQNVWRDSFKDRMLLDGWNAEGQTFRIDLLGEKNQPSDWALPVAAVGGVITVIVLLRFVWDQVI